MFHCKYVAVLSNIPLCSALNHLKHSVTSRVLITVVDIVR